MMAPETTRSPAGLNGAAASPSDDEVTSSMLTRLVHEGPPEMLRHVLDKLPPEDRAMLSRADRACRASVEASGLSLAGVESKPFLGEAFTATVERLRWARANGCPWDESTCAAVAEGGHLAVLKWTRENGCPWDDRTCTHAALRGHLEVLRWARGKGCPW